MNAPVEMGKLKALAPAQMVTLTEALAASLATAAPSAQTASLLGQLSRLAQEAADHSDRLSRRLAELEALSMTDELTGLLNRRGFRMVMERALSSAQRYGEPGMVAYLDLNRFKAVNDTHGHEAGDALLTGVARFLAEHTRQTDYVARLGGDEFAIILVRAEEAGARTRLQALQQKLNASTVAFRGLNLPVSASIGAAAFTGHCTVESVINAADQAMYRNKNAGRHARADRLEAKGGTEQPCKAPVAA